MKNEKNNILTKEKIRIQIQIIITIIMQEK